MANPRPRRRGTDLVELPPLTGGVETRLHAACVKAGAAAALQVALERIPLLKPFLPKPVVRAARGDAAERLQRLLVKDIYARHRLKPARWEVEAILAVAQTQSVLTPLASQEGLQAVLRAWVPAPLRAPLIRFTPLEPLVSATAKAVAATWAAGRYADSVCRLRKAGADWLPAPVVEALGMTPTTLRRWSVEALSLALPPLRLAASWGKRAVAPTVAPPVKSAARKRKSRPKQATGR